ncbi:MAG: 2OG-Fe dioxygenase family protein [Polyangiales bacterium]
MEQLELARYREALRRDGYVVVPEQPLGLGSEFRRAVVERYFGALQRDLSEVHPDRGRLRAVFRYAMRDEQVELHEQACVDIANRNHQGVRRYPRVELGGDPNMAGFVRGALALLPPEARPAHSTFSINFFRTRSAVTMGPHQDHERFIVVHVLRKLGAGANTLLYDAQDQERVVARICLQEGDTMVFEDRRFLHHVTPLVSHGGGPCERDALVCTVDHPETYGLTA